MVYIKNDVQVRRITVRTRGTIKTHPIPDSALDADIAILGKKGRGKTFTAKGIVERLLQMQRRVVVLDPLSVWWGLKSAADGKAEGFPIPVFGGPHADIPLHDGAGPIIGQLIVSSGISAVLDLGLMRKAEQAHLVADLLDYLFTHNRDPLWLVLEEADAFAPQQPMGDLNRVLGEVDRIARRGRNFGFRLISITQRPAKLNKDVLTQLSTLVALGVTSPQDRDAIKAWVDGNADREQAKKVYDSLAVLPVGEGWIWAPDFDLLERVKFPPIRTLDTSKTPKAGDARIGAPVLATADITKIAAQIQAIQSERPATRAIVAQLTPRTPRGTSASNASARAPTPPQVLPKYPPAITATSTKELAEAVAAVRVAADLTQAQLASKMKTTQQTIHRLEKKNGKSPPTTRTLQKVAKATGHELVISFVKRR
jgi:ribosome-binding protein aMBF1 (putative translation factor)